MEDTKVKNTYKCNYSYFSIKYQHIHPRNPICMHFSISKNEAPLNCVQQYLIPKHLTSNDTMINGIINIQKRGIKGWF